MKTRISVSFVGAILLISSLASSQQSNKAESLYQEALMQMEGKGNFNKALEIFDQILKDYAGNRQVSARSQYQIGVCYEKLGKTEAKKAYERVVKNFADQPQVVAEARTRLAALSTSSETSHGPVAHRVLSGADTDEKNLYDIYPSWDGRRVAFVSAYDFSLNVRDNVSGNIQRVSPGAPDAFHYYSPRWSPDGMRLAVTEHDRQKNSTSIKLIDVATQKSVTLRGSDFQGWKEPLQWSKDGRFLLCERSQSPGLLLIAIDDGTIKVLAENTLEATGSISPDGRFVTYAIGKKDNAQIFIQAVAGGARHQLTEATGGNRHVLWSPDGRAIAYEHTGGIWVVPMSNGTTSGAPRLALSTPRIRLWAWTEAGLFYTLWNDADKVRKSYQIEMDPGTGKVLSGEIQPLPAAVPEKSSGFCWSPDMRRIAFRPSDQGSKRIAVYSLDSRTLMTYNIGVDGFIGGMWWSTDGKEIQFEYSDREFVPEAQFTVMALDLNSGKVQQLFPYRRDWYMFSVSADGRLMAYYRCKKDNSYIHLEAIVVAPFGKTDGEHAVINRPGTTKLGFVPPQLSPQGDKVLFARQEYLGGDASFPHNGATLGVAGSDGSDTRRLATLTFIRSMVWDPSGRFIAYSGKADSGVSAPSVLRVVEIATGVEREISLHELTENDIRVTDWSADGRYLGIVAGPHWGNPAWLEEHPEFWVVKGLQEGVR